MTTDPNANDGPTPPVEPVPSNRPPAGSGFFDSIRRSGVYRADERWVGGVAGGVAARIGWDPILVRGLLVLTFFLGGIGLIAYAIGWAFLPEQSDGRIHLEQAVRGHFDVALFGAAVLLLVGFAWGGTWNWGWYGNGDWFGAVFWLAVIGGLIYLLVRAVKRRPSVEGEPHAQPYPTQPYPGQAEQQPYQAQPQQPYQGQQQAQHESGPAYHGPHYPVAPYVASDSGQPGQPGQPGTQAGAPPVTPPHVQPMPPRPPRPRPPKGGGGGIVVGLILLLGALFLAGDAILDISLPFELSPGATWIGVSLLIVGIAIVIAGLRGRSSGGLGALAIIGLILGLPAAAFSTAAPDITRHSGAAFDAVQGLVESNPQHVISEGTAAPIDPARAEAGYEVQLGNPTIDLTRLDLSDDTALGDQIQIPIEVNAGSTTIIVPADRPVEVDVSLSAGTVDWRVGGQNQTATGPGGDAYFATDDIGERDQDNVMISLDLDVTAGAVTIEEEK